MIQGYPIVYMDESGFEHETIRPYGYAPIGNLVSIATTGKVKNVPTSLVPCTKEYYLHLITSRKTSTEMYSITGASTR
ncbi:hypothetical protein [Psychrobacter glacincola]|uniref:hypothetical protein n=1 Tax=Psychrobacter glacincola TaxID=56810 RepID=UPI0039B093B2